MLYLYKDRNIDKIMVADTSSRINEVPVDDYLNRTNCTNLNIFGLYGIKKTRNGYKLDCEDVYRLGIKYLRQMGYVENRARKDIYKRFLAFHNNGYINADIDKFKYSVDRNGDFTIDTRNGDFINHMFSRFNLEKREFLNWERV